jgi:hypothetical protein
MSIFRLPSEDDSTNVHQEFNVDLPDDIKYKILSFYPKHILSLNTKFSSLDKECYLNYCYDRPITKAEIIKYFKNDCYIRFIAFSKINGKVTGDDLEYIYLYHPNDHIVKIKSVYKGFGYEKTIQNDNAYSYIFDNNTNIIIFDNDTTRAILSQRLSCVSLDHNYINNYIEKRNKAFLHYFKHYPIIIFKFLSITRSSLSNIFVAIMEDFIKNSCKYNNWVRDDDDSWLELDDKDYLENTLSQFY